MSGAALGRQQPLGYRQQRVLEVVSHAAVYEVPFGVEDLEQPRPAGPPGSVQRSSRACVLSSSFCAALAAGDFTTSMLVATSLSAAPDTARLAQSGHGCRCSVGPDTPAGGGMMIRLP